MTWAILYYMSIEFYIYSVWYIRFFKNQFIWNRVVAPLKQKQSPELFCKKGVLRNFAKLTGKHLCQSVSHRPAALLKKRLWHRCFPVNFAQFSRTPTLVTASPKIKKHFRSRHYRCSVKKLLKFFQSSRKTRVPVCFLTKLQALDSGTGVVL